jgi:hypothetical protein
VDVGEGTLAGASGVAGGGALLPWVRDLVARHTASRGVARLGAACCSACAACRPRLWRWRLAGELELSRRGARAGAGATAPVVASVPPMGGV